jgi:hypothetical protein
MAHWSVLVNFGLQLGSQMLVSQLGRSRDNWWYKGGACMTLVQVSIQLVHWWLLVHSGPL